MVKFAFNRCSDNARDAMQQDWLQLHCQRNNERLLGQPDNRGYRMWIYWNSVDHSGQPTFMLLLHVVNGSG